MLTAAFFRARIDAMINLNDPLAVLATRFPWDRIEASLAAKFERQDRAGQILEGARDVRSHAGVGGRGHQQRRSTQAGDSPDGQPSHDTLRPIATTLATRQGGKTSFGRI